MATTSIKIEKLEISITGEEQTKPNHQAFEEQLDNIFKDILKKASRSSASPFPGFPFDVEVKTFGSVAEFMEYMRRNGRKV